MDLVLKPIGFVISNQKEPYQAARQPDQLSEPASIKINPEYKQALQDLAGCSHIWLIFGFHHNTNWKPLVQTPRSDRKIGVFATRAPYRPNPIGLSCVPLISVDEENLYLEIGPNDLLDGTPIYDIKPYVTEDQIQEAKVDWLENSLAAKMAVSFSPIAEGDLDFLESEGLKELRPFILRQLEYDPTNKDKKRVEQNGGAWTLSYRTWRIDFIISENSVGVVGIRSGYTSAELKDFNDPYKDKALHRNFLKYQT